MFRKSTWSINITEATGYDIRLHGIRFITLEFAFGTLLGTALAVLNLFVTARSLVAAITGIWALGFGFNSLTIMAIALSVARGRAALPPMPLDKSKILRFSWLFPLLLVLPFVLTLVALLQAFREH